MISGVKSEVWGRSLAMVEYLKVLDLGEKIIVLRGTPWFLLRALKSRSQLGFGGLGDVGRLL